MDSGKLFIEKMNFGIYLVILLTALLNRIFGFFNPYDHEMYVGKFAGIGQIFYLMVSFVPRIQIYHLQIYIQNKLPRRSTQ